MFRLPDKFTRKFTRKPFPGNMRALRECRIAYGQFGEDVFLTSLLSYNKYEGVYVDVGCFRPIRFSNTYVFYQRGWHGLAIDPNPRWRAEWKKFRPRDQFVNLAVAPVAASMTYLMDADYPECNRLVAEPPSHLAPHETLTTVTARPLHETCKSICPTAR